MSQADLTGDSDTGLYTTADSPADVRGICGPGTDIVRPVSAAPAISDAEARFDATRRRIGLIAGPALFVALWFAPLGLEHEAHALAAILALVIVLWVTEAVPLAAAAILGPALAPLLGVMGPKEALAAFADPLIFLFMGGFMLAAALSRHGFARRAALWLISRKIVAGSPSRALIAICSISFVFSMWISNTAATAMLLPVALGLHVTMRSVVGDDPETVRALDRFGGGMCLAMAYTSSMGGATTPIGTGPNVIAVGLLEQHLSVRIDFLQWMSFAFPTMLVMGVLVVVGALRSFPSPLAQVPGLTAEVQRQLEELGPIKKAEIRTLVVFAIAVAGWLTPSVIKIVWGPEHAYADWAKSHLSEGVVAIVCACVLFFIPTSSSAPDEKEEKILRWDDAQGLDWGTLFLLGGGLALGRMTLETGLAKEIGVGVLALAGPIASHPLGLTAAAVLLVIFLTEVMSNTATTSMMLLVLIGVAQAANFDSIPMGIGVTLAASCAFMLPVSTPPNAMAYGTRMVRLDMMAKFGFRLDLIGFVVIMGCVIALLPFVL